jgi:hypothetical protein
MPATRFILDVRDKKKLTETLVQQLDPELGITVEHAYNTWWHNLRNRGGMRLTSKGHETFTRLLKIKHYNFNLEPFDLNSKLIIAMDRRLQQPYYIVTKKMMPIQIIFFGSKEAMMANLYGDIKKFIDNYKQ